MFERMCTEKMCHLHIVLISEILSVENMSLRFHNLLHSTFVRQRGAAHGPCPSLRFSSG